MKQIYQNVGTGDTIIDEVPLPQCRKGHVLIRSSYSLISAGTERMLVDFGKSNYLQKARKQPEKVAMVLDKVKTDGLLPTIDAVTSKLNQPLPMGYSNVGVVLEVGDGVTNFKVGDRVVSNGSHAEVVCVPVNLVSSIPDNVPDQDAVFTVVGSIALQGVRLAEPTIGESIVVMGLGLIGLLTVQILKANGCRVLGFDFDKNKVDIAKTFGAEAYVLDSENDPIQIADLFSRKRGVDAVIITASTNSNEPVHNAATMCRKNGRIVLVGVVGLDLQRNDFYEKEISFRVSCSYGPGRYDPFYETEGNDYPIGFVRWTENRNFEAILDMFSSNSLLVKPLVSHNFNFEKAHDAYDVLISDPDALGIMLEYDFPGTSIEKTVRLESEINSIKPSENKAILALIGAGNHAGRTLLPEIAKLNKRLKTISSSQGVSGSFYGRKYKFENNTTDVDSIYSDQEINTLVIATRHDTHAGIVLKALEAEKNVFVEKPLALNLDQLDSIETQYTKAKKDIKLMVGFNRRFSPLVTKLKSATKNNQPMAIVYNCNAGYVESDSWVHDKKIGGGRLVGEACHFIDLCRFLVDSKITSLDVKSMTGDSDLERTLDNFILSLNFSNGSIASINYFANGNRSYPKESLHVFQSGGIAVIENYKKLKSYGFNGLKSQTLLRQDKGISNCLKAFLESVETGAKSPIQFEEIIEVSRFSIEAAEKLVIKD